MKLLKTVNRLTAFLVFSTIALLVTTVDAAEITVKNDAIPAAGSGTPLLAFIPNEQAAAWLTTPVAGDIVGVQVLWASQFGGNPASQELGIHVYAAGTFPTPGALLASVTGPLMVDGSVNEFRFRDPPANNLPLQVPVSAGQTFVVAIEFLNQNAGNQFGTSVEIDGDGCQPGKNSVLVIPGGWNDAGLLGVTGDFGIRAVINPIPEPDSLSVLVPLLGGLALLRRGRSARS